MNSNETPVRPCVTVLCSISLFPSGILEYSDDTAMARCVVQSLLTRAGFDEQDMARRYINAHCFIHCGAKFCLGRAVRALAFHFSRFAKEYSASPGRGYGSGVIQVLKKLASPQLKDVYQPARDQFNGRGSFGNGGAMRAAPFALGFRNVADVKRVRKEKQTLFLTPPQNISVCYIIYNIPYLTDIFTDFLCYKSYVRVLIFSLVCTSGCHADPRLLSGLQWSCAASVSRPPFPAGGARHAPAVPQQARDSDGGGGV